MFTYGIIDNNGIIQSTTTSDTRINQRDHVFLSAEDNFDASSYIGRKFPKPAPIGTKITRLAMRNRFTFAEKVDIENAKATDAEVKVFADDMVAANYIDLSDQNTIDGVNMLEQKGLIDAGRASEILTGEVADTEVYN